VALQTEQAQIPAEGRRTDADIGPLRYAAMLVGLDSEQAMRLLILLMVLTCDPMAIVLVIAASARNHRWKNRSCDHESDNRNAHHRSDARWQRSAGRVDGNQGDRAPARLERPGDRRRLRQGAENA
jgi:hypothetical protein